jgi:hypothetical protein
VLAAQAFILLIATLVILFVTNWAPDAGGDPDPRWR